MMTVQPCLLLNLLQPALVMSHSAVDRSCLALQPLCHLLHSRPAQQMPQQQPAARKPCVISCEFTAVIPLQHATSSQNTPIQSRQCPSAALRRIGWPIGPLQTIHWPDRTQRRQHCAGPKPARLTCSAPPRSLALHDPVLLHTCSLTRSVGVVSPPAEDVDLAHALHLSELEDQVKRAQRANEIEAREAQLAGIDAQRRSRLPPPASAPPSTAADDSWAATVGAIHLQTWHPPPFPILLFAWRAMASCIPHASGSGTPEVLRSVG